MTILSEAVGKSPVDAWRLLVLRFGKKNLIHNRPSDTFRQERGHTGRRKAVNALREYLTDEGIMRFAAIILSKPDPMNGIHAGSGLRYIARDLVDLLEVPKAVPDPRIVAAEKLVNDAQCILEQAQATLNTIKNGGSA